MTAEHLGNLITLGIAAGMIKPNAKVLLLDDGGRARQLDDVQAGVFVQDLARPDRGLFAPCDRDQRNALALFPVEPDAERFGLAPRPE